MKTLAAAAFLAVSAAPTVDAQTTRPFRDSWFWGASAGVSTYAASDLTNPSLAGVSKVAPMATLDWLITRTKGGLYVSYSQAFMTTQGAILNGPSSSDTGYRVVDVKGLRRFNMIAVAFPGDYIKLHPYIGAGISFGYLGDAAAGGTFTQQGQIDYATSAVNQVKAALGPAFLGGVQYRLKGISVFGQGTVTAMNKQFLLANGHTLSMSADFGVRYNLGSSIDRDY